MSLVLGADEQGRAWSVPHEKMYAHSYSVGGSGAGKSNFLEHRIRKAFYDTKSGLCLLDRSCRAGRSDDRPQHYG